MLWRHAFVLRVLVDGGSHPVKIFFEHVFFSNAVFYEAASGKKQ